MVTSRSSKGVCSLALAAFAGGLGVAATCLWARPAAAYQQTMTCYQSGLANVCEPDEKPVPIEWPQGCVTYKINEVGTTKVDDAPPGLSIALEQAVIESFDTWNQVDCSSAYLKYGGRTTQSAAEYNRSSRAANTNLVVWRETNWESIASAQTFAQTSVSYNPDTGVIADVDIEINAQYFKYSTTDPIEADHVDLRNTLVHEVGHFIGLDHVDDSGATMYRTADVGENLKRTLSRDDKAGICAIYPQPEDPSDAVCQGGSRGGNLNGGGGRTYQGYACALAPGHPARRPFSWVWLAAGALAAAGIRRRDNV